MRASVLTLAAGTRLDRYEIRSKIGEGGMGEVYRARDEKLNRDVAIKVLPVALSQDRERLLRFEQEAQAAGALNHPNILSVYDVDTFEGAPYLDRCLEKVNLAPCAHNSRSCGAAVRAKPNARLWERWVTHEKLSGAAEQRLIESGSNAP